jgi:ATP-dependent helicase/nuclease subunit A
MAADELKPDAPRVPLAQPVPPKAQPAPPDKGSTWTDEQSRAITTRGVSVSLSAGAGCGKTFVLTERFLSHLDPNGPNPARLGQLLAITFTERAAREMRDRIRSRCRDRLLECPEADAGYWLELLRELDTARISTIHSFCGSLLRSHAVEAGLNPAFRILDQAQADTLLSELIDDSLRNKLAERSEAVMDLIVRYGLGKLRGMIAQLLDCRQEIDWAYWSAMRTEDLAARWEDYFRREALPRLLSSISDSPQAHAVLEIARQKPSDNQIMQTQMAFLLDYLPKLAECSDPAAILSELRDATMIKGAGTKKNWLNNDLYDKYKQAVTSLRKSIDAVNDRITFDPQAALPAAEAGLQLLRLAEEVNRDYDDEKRESGALDFNDLLIRAKNLLVGPQGDSLRKRLASHLHLLLVDEFQDTDPLQVELVKAMCDNDVSRGKLFFVGDFKQSIYRFRGADPRVFRSLSEKIPQQGRQSLLTNFRSQPAILDFVNALFDGEFLDYEPLRADKPQIAPTPAVEFLWAAQDGSSDEHNALSHSENDVHNSPLSHRERARVRADDFIDTSNSSSSDLSTIVQAGHSKKTGDKNGDENEDDQKPAERRRRREADWIARRIRLMLDSGEKIVWDQDASKAGKPGARAVRPGDVVLLFRALGDVEYYEAALRRYGVDYYLVGGHAFYAQQEVFDLLNLLGALDSPCDQLSLLGALRSPFFNLPDETIFWLARHPDGLSAGLFSETPPPQLDKEQRRRAEFAARTLCALRSIKDRVPIARLIAEAIDRTAYDAVLMAEFLGERKLANLYKLIDEARSFDQSGMFTLSDFIAQLAGFVARPPKEPLAPMQSETMDVVRLMTIHQAKGLEFPVVIVPDMNWSQRGPRPAAAFTPELGPLVGDDEATTGYDLYSIVEKEEEKKEDLRLLYVAATRAADYLIFSSGLDESGRFKGPWMELLSRRFDFSTGATLLQAKVKVTLSRPRLESEPSESSARQSLKNILKKADEMAKKGEGRLPKHLAPASPDRSARRQFSFSRLSGTLQERTSADVTSLPETEDLLEPVLDPLGLGTLVHAVLAEVDYADPGDFGEIIRRHAPLHIAGLELSDVNFTEPIEIIGRFLGSQRAAQIAAAQEVYRELEFLLAWPPDNPLPGGWYLRGFIDCLYRDSAGRWRIIDYKTNRVTAQTLQKEAAKYEMQMLVYGLAAEKILKSPPAELTLCFLRPGLEYNFVLNDKAKRRVIDIVNESIQKAANDGRT